MALPVGIEALRSAAKQSTALSESSNRANDADTIKSQWSDYLDPMKQRQAMLQDRVKEMGGYQQYGSRRPNQGGKGGTPAERVAALTKQQQMSMKLDSARNRLNDAYSGMDPRVREIMGLTRGPGIPMVAGASMAPLNMGAFTGYGY